VQLPPTVPATLAYMHETGAYLISNGTLLVLWLGRSADPGWVAQVRPQPRGRTRSHARVRPA
jgi:protein transport protein SEC24